MLCPSCNNYRPATTAPCPSCQAASPLVNNGWGGSNASFGTGNAWGNQDQTAESANSWGGPMNTAIPNDWSALPADQQPFAPNFWQDPAASGVQQMGFPTINNQQQPGGSENSFWSRNMAAPQPQGGQAGQQSLVPYQPPVAPASQSLMVMPNGFPTINNNALVPALPETGQDAAIYVPPMYTNPRPLIPRYRAISGLLSVIIVMGLLCAGAGYYAQVTGRLVFIQQMLGTYTPPKITTGISHTLAVPSTQETPGPGANFILSAAIGSSIDKTSGQIPVLINQFNVGDQIYVSCSLNITKPGQIVAKWYTGNLFWRSSPPLAATPEHSAIFSIVYDAPTEGRVELYWNNQLAMTLLFVVQPAP
jgi:hypothetical protein